MHFLIDQLELELYSGLYVNDPLDDRGKLVRPHVVELQKQSSFAVFYDDDEEDEDCGRLRPVPPALVSRSSEYYCSSQQQQQQKRQQRNRRSRRYLSAPAADQLLLMEDSVPGDEELGYRYTSGTTDTNDELLYPACQDRGLVFRHFAAPLVASPLITSFSYSEDDSNDEDEDDDNGDSIYYCYKYYKAARTKPHVFVHL